MNVDGSNPVNLTNHPNDDFSSSWTNDGSHLFFNMDRDGNWDIYSIEPNGMNPVRLTTDPDNDEYPVWKP